jgi:IclR family acetate operon transcriptional repressor
VTGALDQIPAAQPLPVKSADRVLDIFELLASAPHGLTIAEISDRLSLARSSTHGLVRTLHARGYLMQNGGRRYHLGARLIELGLNVSDRLELRAAARTPLERLVAEVGVTALLVVPDGPDLLYVDKVVSYARAVRTDVTARRPLQCSALGKALLATLPDPVVEAVVERYGLEPATAYSITDIGRLREDLEAARARGYAVDMQEAIEGVFCVGAPVRDHTGQAIAAISLSTINEFYEPETTGPLVAATAVEISRAMGWKGSAGTLLDQADGDGHLLLSDGAER